MKKNINKQWLGNYLLYVILQIKIHTNHAVIYEEGKTNFGEKYHTCI